jgi:hypothetical protein
MFFNLASVCLGRPCSPSYVFCFLRSVGPALPTTRILSCLRLVSGERVGQQEGEFTCWDFTKEIKL